LASKEYFQIKSDSPVAEDLMFWRVVGHEALSRPSFYELTVISKNQTIEAKDVLGHAFDVVISFLDPDGTPHQRHCKGHAIRFTRMAKIGRYYRYEISLQSWFGLLSKRTNSRIHQDLPVLDIFDSVLADSPIQRVKKTKTDGVIGKHEGRRYCVQHLESDYTFLSRLLEDEGIYYWFDSHEATGTMYLADASDAAHEMLPVTDILKYIPSGSSDARHNEITKWISTRQLETGKYSSRDSDFKAIKKKLSADKADPDTHELADLEAFEYEGGYFKDDDSEGIAKLRVDELASRRQRHWALTSWPDVTAGRSFTLAGDPDGNRDGDYLIAACSFVVSHPGYEGITLTEEPRSITHLLRKELAGDAVNADTQVAYRALIDSSPSLRTGQPGARAFMLTVLPLKVPYRVPRLTPKVVMPGPQSAIVVGPEGEEIHADDFGRVKVHFHWDRYDESNEKSTCWVRVSQPWAGKGWGGYFIPRIGQEVIVDFLNGDPDRPIIVGRVYNDHQPKPFDSHTQSGFRTRSTPKGSAANCNEFRFDDKKGEEQVYLHAEKNQDISVENDETHTVGHDRTKTIDNDETNHIKRDRTETVDRNEKINVHGWRTEEVDLDESITVHKNRTERVDLDEKISIGKNRSENVAINETISIGANRSVTIGGAKSETVAKVKTETIGLAKALSIGLGYQTTVGAAMNTTVVGFQATQVGLYKNILVGGNWTNTVKASYSLDVSKDVVIDAGSSITLRVGKSLLVMKKDGTFTINGKDIDVVGTKHVGVESKRIDLN
jgi:type VI secretion system secreted protein VgrG